MSKSKRFFKVFLYDSDYTLEVTFENNEISFYSPFLDEVVSYITDERDNEFADDLDLENQIYDFFKMHYQEDVSTVEVNHF